MPCIREPRRFWPRPGFTLLELLVVIAIVAVLASFVAPTVFRNVGDAKQATAKTQIDAFALALDTYRVDNDRYPTSEQGLVALRIAPLGIDAPANWRGPYLSRAPGEDPWRRPYMYRSPGVANPESFDLWSLGRDGRVGGAGEDADITSWGGPVPP